ncbi:hypothetical protein Cha6605_2220 [Chamaesiphon minutus PCC 6605]|uniref:Uncharacterized protein n=2 Tax=Chamaesiphon TaxID=217161 RepID=K9UF91_CHAP6|nr:hypothetical protein Cha6605_2220 [Chamaesiphon minutus PCC 6605]
MWKATHLISLMPGIEIAPNRSESPQSKFIPVKSEFLQAAAAELTT